MSTISTWGVIRAFSPVIFVCRRHYDPAMFEPENLSRILGPEKYEYVLDRWCRSFMLFYRSSFKWIISGIVYNMSPTTQYTCAPFPSSTATSQNRATLTPYSQLGLCETNPLVVWQNDPRHYGPMVFNLCWNKQQDELLVHLVMNDRYSKELQSRQKKTLNNRMEEAVDVVAVYLRLHPECSLAVSSGLKMLSGENLLRRFCQLESLKTGKISMAVAKMVEEKAQRLRLKQSHGAKWLTYRNCLCASVPWIRCITFSIIRENGNMADVLSIQCILKNP